MAGWTQVKVDDMPHIIAGPIVRKASRTEVTIWVAVKSPTPIILKIYSPSGSSPLLTSPSTTPIKVGKNLYITCVTAKGGDVLNSSVLFGYDLEFGANHLNSSGILSSGASGIGKITFNATTERYKSGSVRLPGFLTMPGTITDLNLFHGSCRKPHGQGVDGMVILHDTIKKSQDTGSVTRPHALFLTGDQIYADDVAGTLLHVIMRYHENDSGGDSLIGWKEKLPLVSASDPNLSPGKRNKIYLGKLDVVAEAEDTQSHLFRMTEFILMYCMAWSPELWTDTYPTYDQTYTGMSKTIHYHRSSKDSDAYSRYKKNKSEVIRFKKGLSKTRRAIANIQTYMVFDDHDVTDDLFLSELWVDNVLESNDTDKEPLGRRLMQNGLSAIALCQSWGNNPDQFIGASSAGRKTVNAINSLATLLNGANAAAGDIHWAMIDTMVLPFINYSGSVNRMSHHSGSFHWHWYFEHGEFEVIALDTRTMRSFRNGYDEFSGLLSDEAINYQVKNVGVNSKELTILLSGTPLMGVPSIEDSIFDGADYLYQKETLDLEFWGLDKHARQAMISKLLRRKAGGGTGSVQRVLVLSGDVHYAFTNGTSYKASTSSFIEHELGVELKIAQCCSSAMKNFTTEGTAATLKQHNRKIDETWWAAGVVPYYEHNNNFSVYGWNNASGVSEKIKPVDHLGNTVPYKRKTRNSNIPSLLRDYNIKDAWGLDPTPETFPGAYTTLTYQDWFFSLGFVTNTPVNITAITPPGGSGFDLKASRSRAHKELTSVANKSGGSWMVGFPNMGNIEFNWGPSSKIVQHNIIWINNHGKSAFDAGVPIVYVLTKHYVELA